MVRICLFALLTLLLTSGCNYSSSKPCKAYPEVCEAMDDDQRLSVIVSLKLTSDAEKFNAFLQEHKIATQEEIEVTKQFLLDLDQDEFLVVAKSPLVEDITLDTFYPR